MFDRFLARLHPAPLARVRRANISTRASVVYETFILNPDGSTASRRAPKKNLILDQGLDQVAAYTWADCFRYCAIGLDPDPTRRDSGVITVSRSGTTLTASAGFFESGDVGRIFKFDSGETMYITAYTDTQHVTVDTSGTIAADSGTVWYVNDTALANEAARTNTVGLDSGDNGSSFSVDTITHKRTFIFPPVGSNTLFREIGWSPLASAGANLFGRDVIPGGGDFLVTGQQYKVVVRLILTLSPSAITAQSNVGTGSFDTTGDCNHQYILTSYSYVETDGSSNNAARSLEPCKGAKLGIINTSFSLNAGISYTDANISTLAEYNLTLAGYGTGTFFRTQSVTVPVLGGNSTNITGFFFGSSPGGGAVNKGFGVLFDNPQTKDSDHTLTVELTLTWDRALTN